jgi:hypothetical protein
MLRRATGGENGNSGLNQLAELSVFSADGRG